LGNGFGWWCWRWRRIREWSNCRRRDFGRGKFRLPSDLDRAIGLQLLVVLGELAAQFGDFLTVLFFHPEITGGAGGQEEEE
jgi:hypothetical protein